LSDVLVFLIVLAILVLVVAVVSAPLRRAASGQRGDTGAVAELEAARDAKYREIHDTELDHETGKLSDEDFRATDLTLRAEAVELLHQLDRARDR
jgi:hypothetical protein